MKMNFGLRFFLCSMVLLGLQGLNIVPVNAFDPTPPKLETATLSTDQLPDTGGDVIVTLRVTSKSGFLNHPVFIISLPGDSSRQLGGGIMFLTSGDSKDGVYSTSFHIQPNLMLGKYELVVFPLTDILQNTTNFIHTGVELAYGVSAQPQPTSQPTPSLIVNDPPASTPTALLISVSNPSDLLKISGLKATVDHLHATVAHLLSCLANAKRVISLRKYKILSGC